jgi:nucleoid DNA-binding protein
VIWKRSRNGEQVEIRGFAVLRSAKTTRVSGRNPTTGEIIKWLQKNSRFSKVVRVKKGMNIPKPRNLQYMSVKAFEDIDMSGQRKNCKP